MTSQATLTTSSFTSCSRGETRVWTDTASGRRRTISRTSSWLERERESRRFFKVMFELECDSKRRWITCNGKCELPALEEAGSDLPEPGSLPELVTDILLDSILPEDPHRTEDAVRGITWGGLHLEGVRNRVCEGLPALRSYERILLEKVLGRWRHVFPGDDTIRNCLARLLDEVKRLDEACVLSICVGASGIILKSDMDDPKLMEGSRCEVPSRITTSLSRPILFAVTAARTLETPSSRAAEERCGLSSSGICKMMGSPFRRAGRAISAKSSSIPKCAVAVGSYDR